MAFQTICPATGEVKKTFSEISDTDLEAAVKLAQTAYEADWRHRSVPDRAKIVAAVAAKLRERSEEYAQYVMEMGKLIAEARGAPVAGRRRRIAASTTGDRVSTASHATAERERQSKLRIEHGSDSASR